ncbi:MAG: N-acetyltransferase [Propionibacteriaceae bacterium]|nr:N-acetyltransferase [Propionibacteriaceae bacterium]
MVGHFAFSPIAVTDQTPNWFTLGPVSVLPQFQNQGIGSAPIREGLERSRALGATGCVVVGHPPYYSRFGFVHRDDLTYEGVPPEVFFALSFDHTWPTAKFTIIQDSTPAGRSDLSGFAARPPCHRDSRLRHCRPRRINSPPAERRSLAVSGQSPWVFSATTIDGESGKSGNSVACSA